MKITFFLVIIISLNAFSQNTFALEFISKAPLQADNFVAVSAFKSQFFINNNTLIKQNKDKTYTYSNLQLGTISAVNTFNPLKIAVFYAQFNTAVILDNRLAEIAKIDFNTIPPFTTIQSIATGNDSTLWLYNQDLQVVQMYDYLLNTIRTTTLPIDGQLIDLKSNYNTCWVLTTQYLYAFNYFGSLINKIKNKGYSALSESNGNVVLKNEGYLTRFNSIKNTFTTIPTSDLIVKQFFVLHKTLYIYNGKSVYQFQIKI